MPGSFLNNAIYINLFLSPYLSLQSVCILCVCVCVCVCVSELWEILRGAEVYSRSWDFSPTSVLERLLSQTTWFLIKLLTDEMSSWLSDKSLDPDPTTLWGWYLHDQSGISQGTKKGDLAVEQTASQTAFWNELSSRTKVPQYNILHCWVFLCVCC